MMIYSFRLAKSPNIAASPTCLPMGPIAYAKNGVAIFNALDSSGRNAVELEIFDECKGHSNGEGNVFLDSRTIPSRMIDKHVPGPQIGGAVRRGGRSDDHPFFEKILLFPAGGQLRVWRGGGRTTTPFLKKLFPVAGQLM